MRKLIQEFIQLSPLFVIPSLIIAIGKYRKLSPELKVITYYLILCALTELLAALLAKFSKNNLPLLHIYTVAQFILIARFYGIVLNGFIPRNLTKYCIYLFVVVSVINSLFIQTIFTNNTYTRSFASLMIIAFSLTLFYRIISEMRIEKLERSPVFWINAGLLIYFSSTIFLFVMSNFILPLNKTLNMYIWGVHAFINIFLYCLIGVGLWIYNNK